MSATSCLTCFSEMQIISRSKTQTPPYFTPCCSTPICENCLKRNPRLKEYIPCLRCGDVKSAAGSSRVRIGAVEQQRRDEERERNQFTIGDDDDEDELNTHSELSDRPPQYTEDPTQSASNPHDKSGGTNRISGEETVQMEVVEIKHLVSRSDTLISVARQYAADPHDLLTLNNLPPSSLHTNPNLLQTRREIIISRRLIPSSALPSIKSFSKPTESESIDPQEAARRKKERAVKRFQLLTKTVDPAIGRAYLSLEEVGGEEDYNSSGTSGLDALKGKKVRKDEEYKEKEKTGGGSIDERALERFWDDDDWEQEVGGPYRGVDNSSVSRGMDVWGKLGIKSVPSERKGKWKVVNGGIGPVLGSVKM